MFQDVFLLHGTEGAKAHMEGDIAEPDAPALQPLQQLFCKMQASGGRGGGAGVTGIHCLIAFRVPQLLLDIGRQGHLPQAFQDLQENAIPGKADQASPRLQLFLHGSRQRAVAEAQLHALADPPPRADQALPEAVPPVGEQQDLADAPAGEAFSHQAGRNHPGVVHHQAVAAAEVVRQIGEAAVLQAVRPPVQHHEPGAVPALQRRLGDELRRQLV